MMKDQKKRYGHGMVMGLLLSMELMTEGRSAFGQARVEDESGQELTISVRVYNYTRFSKGLLGQAESDAAGIFRAVGVEVVWTNCNPAGDDLAEDSPCAQFLGPLQLRVRVLPDIPAAPGTAERPLGVALGKNMASVSLRRVREEAGRCQVMPQVVLGPVLAHEIGHLLLGSEGHSATGIMRAHWQPEDYAPPYLRTLGFTPEQALTIRAEVRARLAAKLPSAEVSK
jgi:hypothetical protein